MKIDKRKLSEAQMIDLEHLDRRFDNLVVTVQSLTVFRETSQELQQAIEEIKLAQVRVQKHIINRKEPK